MQESIRRFASQFGWKPAVLRAARLGRYDRVIVCGMGGSHLAADLLKILKPPLELTIWSDYGLPPLPKAALKTSLVIASSYSGNTEETIDAFHAARRAGARRAVIAAGGKLIALAEKERVAAVVMPDEGLQPRSALGLSLRAMLALLGDQILLKESSSLLRTLRSPRYEARGKWLAAALRGRIPLIYASLSNQPIAYNWKIKFNETGKIPAFYNVLPELNHNEMTGFDATPKSKPLSKPFHFVFLADPSDHPRIKKRMRILTKLYRARGLPVTEIPLAGKTPYEKIFSSLLIADWTAYHTAHFYGADPTEVPMVEEFKKLMR